MNVLNLTQHLATPEQVEQGVINLPDADRAVLVSLLTFDELPTKTSIRLAAGNIAALASHYASSHVQTVMIGGAPFLMAALVEELQSHYLRPVFAFSKRESVDEPQPDGSVRKVAVFKHAGWVAA